jgi:hypothetical protein
LFLLLHVQLLCSAKAEKDAELQHYMALAEKDEMDPEVWMKWIQRRCG